MAVQSYSENDSEIRKKKNYKNKGDFFFADRMSFTIFTFLTCVVFYSCLSLQYQMPFVCPIVIYFQMKFSSLYLINCFHEYEPQVNSELLN